MGKQHIIELNGKRYDALTGKQIVAPNTTVVKNVKTKNTGAKSLDGVARQKREPQQSTQQRQRPLEKSHTLMRKTVQKPTNHKLHAVATIVNLKPAQATQPSQPIGKTKLIAKNGLIRKFSPAIFSTASPETGQTKKAQNGNKPLLSAVVANTPPVLVSPLDQAIAHATSHQQSKLKRPRLHSRVAHKLHVNPRVLSGTAVLLAIVLMAGFFGYQNMPNLKMRLASSRAGLHGSLPTYQPPGFHRGNISYKPGQINFSFVSNSDARNFTVTQSTSSWNSDTLRDKLKATSQISMPVEVPDNGKTLFIYNDNNATWVDGGVLYKIEGDSKLNTEQLLHLANSM